METRDFYELEKLIEEQKIKINMEFDRLYTNFHDKLSFGDDLYILQRVKENFDHRGTWCGFFKGIGDTTEAEKLLTESLSLRIERSVAAGYPVTAKHMMKPFGDAYLTSKWYNGKKKPGKNSRWKKGWDDKF